MSAAQKYEYATRAHCPTIDNLKPGRALCGSASASNNHLDEQPITVWADEFIELVNNPDTSDYTCWECRSILGVEKPEQEAS